MTFDNQDQQLLGEAIDILARLDHVSLQLVVATIRPLKDGRDTTSTPGEAAGIVAMLPPKAQAAAVEELRRFAVLLGVKPPSQNRLRLVGAK